MAETRWVCGARRPPLPLRWGREGLWTDRLTHGLTGRGARRRCSRPARPSLVRRAGRGSRLGPGSRGRARGLRGAGGARGGGRPPGAGPPAGPAGRGAPGARAEVPWALEPEYGPLPRLGAVYRSRTSGRRPFLFFGFFEKTAASDTFTAAKSSSGVTCNFTLKIQVWCQNTGSDSDQTRNTL